MMKSIILRIIALALGGLACISVGPLLVYLVNTGGFTRPPIEVVHDVPVGGVGAVALWVMAVFFFVLWRRR